MFLDSSFIVFIIIGFLLNLIVNGIVSVDFKGCVIIDFIKLYKKIFIDGIIELRYRDNELVINLLLVFVVDLICYYFDKYILLKLWCGFFFYSGVVEFVLMMSVDVYFIKSGIKMIFIFYFSIGVSIKIEIKNK